MGRMSGNLSVPAVDASTTTVGWKIEKSNCQVSNKAAVCEKNHKKKHLFAVISKRTTYSPNVL